MFDQLKALFTKQQPVDTLTAEHVEILYAQPDGQHAFKSNQLSDLNRIYVYTITLDPPRLMLTPVTFQLLTVKGDRFIKADVRTSSLLPDKYDFDRDTPIDDVITNVLNDIKNGTMPATLDRNEAIRTVNALNAERQHIQKHYNVTAMHTHVFEYMTIKDVFDILTDNASPDYGVVTS